MRLSGCIALVPYSAPPMALAPYQINSGEPIFYFLSKQPEEIIEPSVERLPE
jgi:hypothetical protein